MEDHKIDPEGSELELSESQYLDLPKISLLVPSIIDSYSKQHSISYEESQEHLTTLEILLNGDYSDGSWSAVKVDLMIFSFESMLSEIEDTRLYIGGLESFIHDINARLYDPRKQAEKQYNEYLKAKLEVLLHKMKFIYENSHRYVSNEAQEEGQPTNETIALYHYYLGAPITRENADKIALKFGKDSKTSGEKLYQRYTHWASSANRRGNPDGKTQKPLINKIALFEEVENMLPGDKRGTIKDEIKILKSYL